MPENLSVSATQDNPLRRMPDALFHEILGPEPLPAFRDEIDQVWGARWGAADEVGRLREVMVRRPGRILEEVEAKGRDTYRDDLGAFLDPDRRWYWSGTDFPDLEALHREFDAFVAALEGAGVHVVHAPVLDDCSKSVFTRDPLVTVPGGAVILRLAPRMRRGEERSITQTVAGAGMPILGTLTGSAVAEGGSFIKVRPDLAFFGTSVRCNAEGHRQLAGLLAEQGITVERYQLPGYQIHLDLCCLMLDDDLALINPRVIPYDMLVRLRGLGVETIETLPDEEWACNALVLDRRKVLFPSHMPRTAELLSQHGVDVIPVDYREMNKNGGGLHCSSMELRRDW